MDQLLNTEIWNGQTVADYLTLEFLVSIAGNLLAALFILFLGFIVAGWVQRRVLHVGEKHVSFDNTLFSFLGNIARYIILGFTFLFVLNTFGVQTTSLIAVIGAAGLAIGLALQGTLSNVAAGVMMILFRPLRLGDFVVINGVMGTVRDITLNFVTLDDPSNVRIVVPNSQVWGNTITNYSVNATRRAEWTFGVGYGADLARAEQVIRDTIMADPRSHNDPAPFVQVNGLGDSSVDFLARVWCSSADYFQYQADMKRQVKEALDGAGVDIPFPTRTLIRSAGDDA